MGRTNKERGHELGYRSANADRAAAALPGDRLPPVTMAQMLRGRLGFLIAFAVIVLGVVVMYARERWLVVVTMGMSDGLIVAGWVGSAWMLGRGLFTAVGRCGGSDEILETDALGRAGQAQRLKESRAFEFAARAGAGMGILSLAALGLALLGGLNRWTVVALLAIGPALTVKAVVKLLHSGKQIQAADWLARSVGGRWVILAMAPAVGMMIAGASIMPGVLWRPEDPHPYDALEYHLQAPREWHDAGRMVQLQHNVYSYFPYGVEMHSLMAMHLRGGAWPAMYQCQFFSVAWVLLAGLATYGVVREMLPRTPSGAAVASAAMVLATTLPWMVMLGAVAYTEGALAFYTALAMGFALRALRADSGRARAGAMIAAGVAAGFACGVKYTAVPIVVIGLGGAVAVASLLSGSFKQMWKPLVGFGLAAVVVMSPWLIRNFVWTGNPVFPLAMKQLGRGHFDEIQIERFRIAHSPVEKDQSISARIAKTWGEIFGNWQYGYLFWWMVAGAVGIAAVGRRKNLTEASSESRNPEASSDREVSAGQTRVSAPLETRAETSHAIIPSILAIAAFLIIALIVWIGFTHLLGRFYVLCIPIGAMAIGLVRWQRWPACAAALAVLSALISWWPFPTNAVFNGPRGQQDHGRASAMLHARLASYGTEKWQGFYGLEDEGFLLPEELKDIGRSGETVWLLGDAQGFLYPVPSTRLKYRTVFDLPGDAKDMYQAWLAMPQEKARGIGAVVIHPGEIDRLSRTYYKVPGLPPELKSQLIKERGQAWEEAYIERK